MNDLPLIITIFSLSFHYSCGNLSLSGAGNKSVSAGGGEGWERIWENLLRINLRKNKLNILKIKNL